MNNCANPNLCEDCVEAKQINIPSLELSDTGRCGCCKNVREVFDLELLAFYGAMGFSSEHIYAHLPRLRYGRPGSELDFLTWIDIATKITPLVRIIPPKI